MQDVQRSTLESLKRWVHRTLLVMRNRRNSRGTSTRAVETAPTFDEIYSKSLWDEGSKGREVYSGPGSHDELVVMPYVSAVTEFLRALPTQPSVVDLGCGDFNVGKHLLAYSRDYTGCDASQIVVDHNSKTYIAENLRFTKLDITADSLPKADVALIRQVLQHLSNEQILAFVCSLKKTRPYKYLVVSEHLPAWTQRFPANLDQPTGDSIRLHIGSGVDLTCPPFNLEPSNSC